MTDTTPGGWLDAARPGYPKDPERNGAHWVAAENGTPFLVKWDVRAKQWDADGLPFQPAEMARVRYLGPCHTPAEVAALVEAARREEREANISACRKAVPRAHTYASENADIYRAGDAARDMCIAAIRARGDA